MPDNDSDKKQAWLVPVVVAVVGTIGTIAVAVINKPPALTSSNPSPSSPAAPTTPSSPSTLPSGVSSPSPSPTSSVSALNPMPSPNPPGGDELKPTTDYSLSKFRGAHLRLGNTRQQQIILVSDLTLQWDFVNCPKLEMFREKLPVAEYRYTVDITQNRGSKLLDRKTFKYALGDVDDFYVDIRYPGNGIYQVWLEFKYSSFGSSSLKLYQTQKESISRCHR